MLICSEVSQSSSSLYPLNDSETVQKLHKAIKVILKVRINFCYSWGSFYFGQFVNIFHKSLDVFK